jgi:peptide/nickel transport system substrate-binding protein
MINGGVAMDAIVPGGFNRKELLRRGSAGAVGLGVLGAVGCGSDDKKTSSTSSSGDKPPSAPTGVLRVGLKGTSAEVIADPRAAILGDSGEIRRAMIHDGLTDVVFGKTIMRLATDIKGSADAKTWDITLREGVKFHDGKPFGPEDVIESVRLYQAKTSGLVAVWSNAVSVTKTGANSVQIKLKAPDATFVTKYGRQLWVMPVGYDPHKPVGTGPFKLESIQLGTKTVMSANPDYYGDDGPYVKTLELYEFKDDAARLNAFNARQVDVIDSVPSPQLAPLKATKGINVAIVSSNAYTPFLMDTTQAPFDDVRVRQAMRLIVDRKGMLTQVLAGIGTIANDLFAPGDPYYIGNDVPQREQDPEQVKALLKAAGHESTTFELHTGEVAPASLELSQVFVEQAKACGVKVKLKQHDPTSYFTPDAGYGSYPFFMSLGGGTTYLDYAAISLAPDAQFPETKWKDPEWDRLYTQALGTVDEAARGELTKKLQQIDYDRGGIIIPLFQGITTASVDKVKGISKETGANRSFNDFRLETFWVSS